MKSLMIDQNVHGRGANPQFVAGWNAAINAVKTTGPDSIREPVKVNCEFNSGWSSAMLLIQAVK